MHHVPVTTVEDNRPVERFSCSIVRFMHLESTAGLMLLAVTVLAMIVKNTMHSNIYTPFLITRGSTGSAFWPARG